MSEAGGEITEGVLVEIVNGKGVGGITGGMGDEERRRGVRRLVFGGNGERGVIAEGEGELLHLIEEPGRRKGCEL